MSRGRGLTDFWRGCSIDHVCEVVKLGCKVGPGYSKNCALCPSYYFTEDKLAWLLFSSLVVAADSW